MGMRSKIWNPHGGSGGQKTASIAAPAKPRKEHQCGVPRATRHPKTRSTLEIGRLEQRNTQAECEAWESGNSENGRINIQNHHALECAPGTPPHPPREEWKADKKTGVRTTASE
jgi:hypothetical protein